MIKLKCLDGSAHIGTHLRFILREAQSVLAKFHLDGGWYQPWYCTSGQVLVGGTSATMVLHMWAGVGVPGGCSSIRALESARMMAAVGEGGVAADTDHCV